MEHISSMINLRKEQWKRDTLMNWLIEVKDSPETILKKLPLSHDFSDQYDCLLSIGGASDIIASKLGTVSAQFYKIRNVHMKSIRSFNRVGIQNFLDIDYDVEGKTVLLVDDIVTTGTTLSEASRILKARGVRSISAVTLFGISGSSYLQSA